MLVPQTEEAKPQDAPRVAPTPAETPSPEAEIASLSFNGEKREPIIGTLWFGFACLGSSGPRR